MRAQYHEDVSILRVADLQHSQEDFQVQYRAKNHYLEIHCRRRVRPFQYKPQLFFEFFLGLGLHEFYNINFVHLALHSLDYHQDQTHCFLLVHNHPSFTSFTDTVLVSYTEHHINHQPSFIDIAIAIHKVVVDKPVIILGSSHLNLLAFH